MSAMINYKNFWGLPWNILEKLGFLNYARKRFIIIITKELHP